MTAKQEALKVIAPLTKPTDSQIAVAKILVARRKEVGSVRSRVLEVIANWKDQ